MLGVFECCDFKVIFFETREFCVLPKSALEMRLNNAKMCSDVTMNIDTKQSQI